jgi:hypothetical protein
MPHVARRPAVKRLVTAANTRSLEKGGGLGSRSTSRGSIDLKAHA